jgi:adenylosuccinate synthase
MPISIVVGGQLGSEGKGKVALKIAQDEKAAAVVRVGGTNSGHTAVDENGRTWALRQLPVSVLAPDAIGDASSLRLLRCEISGSRLR